MEKQETKMMDWKSKEKIDNKNPGQLPVEIPGNPPTAQEHHHARHALYFLYFGTYSVVNHKTAWCTREKTERVLVHLNCLREFVAGGSALERAVNELLCRLNWSQPGDAHEWGHFLADNWTWIRQIAAHYGEDKKCFPDVYFHALKKIVTAGD